MASSVIGALRVDLGINSAQFTAGLKNAQGALGKFGAVAARGFAAVAAGATVAAGALGIAVKGAIDHADALSKASQKAGVTVEALSRLEYAAKLSDVSLESLTGGLQKLSKGMADAAGGKGPAAAFKALGIAVTESNGQLRDGNAVFADIADRFSRLEDGATKTALAIQIFGKSGADMIPLLNSGRDGLKSMADESDRLGATISTKTAKAAEEFNDNLTRLSQVMQGLVNRVMEAVLPALQSFSEWLVKLDPQVVAVGVGLTSALAVLGPVAGGLGAIAAAARLAAAGVGALAAQIANFSTAIGALPSLGLSVLAFYFGSTTPVGAGEDALVNQMREKWEARKKALYDLRAQLTGASKGAGGTNVYDGIFVDTSLKLPIIPPFDTSAAVKSLEPLDLGIDTTTTKVETLADKIGGPLSNAIIGFKDAVMSGTNPLKAFADQLGNIGSQLANSAIQGLVSAALGGISFGGGAPALGGFSFGGPSFDGGGYTGMGSRSGGLDGKGGFLGMLHPDETVVDHTRGQGGPTVSIVVNADTFARGADLARVIEPVVSRVVRQYGKNPDRV